MKKQNQKWFVRALLLFALAVLIIYYVHDDKINQAASVNATQSTPELEAAKAVTILPSGTEEAWNAYVDRRIAATLHRNGAVVQLIGGINEILGQSVYVSINSPYIISCDAGGGSIEFGYPQKSATEDGSNDSSVYIYGMVANADHSAEKSPPLGVSELSVAAEKLRAHLCQRIADRVQIIMAPQNPSDSYVK